MANREALVVVDVHVPASKEQEGNALTQNAARTLKLAESFTIELPQDFELAGQELRKIALAVDGINAHRLSITREIDASKARIMDKFKPAIALLEQAKSEMNRKMMAWRNEQERRRAEEQRKLDEAAAAERKRLEAEAAKLAKKSPEKAAEKLEQAAQVTAPIVAPASVPTVKGVATRKTWRCDEQVDIIALCKAVLAGTVAPLAIEPNFVFLNEQARSLQEHFGARFPGCKAVCDEKFGRVRG